MRKKENSPGWLTSWSTQNQVAADAVPPFFAAVFKNGASASALTPLRQAPVHTGGRRSSGI